MCFHLQLTEIKKHIYTLTYRLIIEGELTQLEAPGPFLLGFCGVSFLRNAQLHHFLAELNLPEDLGVDLKFLSYSSNGCSPGKPAVKLFIYLFGLGQHPAVLRGYTWFCNQELLLMALGGPYGILRNLGWLIARQMSYTLCCYHSSPLHFYLIQEVDSFTSLRLLLTLHIWKFQGIGIVNCG